MVLLSRIIFPPTPLFLSLFCPLIPLSSAMWQLSTREKRRIQIAITAHSAAHAFCIAGSVLHLKRSKGTGERCGGGLTVWAYYSSWGGWKKLPLFATFEIISNLSTEEFFFQFWVCCIFDVTYTQEKIQVKFHTSFFTLWTSKPAESQICCHGETVRPNNILLHGWIPARLICVWIFNDIFLSLWSAQTSLLHHRSKSAQKYSS